MSSEVRPGSEALACVQWYRGVTPLMSEFRPVLKTGRCADYPPGEASAFLWRRRALLIHPIAHRSSFSPCLHGRARSPVPRRLSRERFRPRLATITHRQAGQTGGRQATQQVLAVHAGSAFRGSAEQATRGRHGPVHVEAAHCGRAGRGPRMHVVAARTALCHGHQLGCRHRISACLLRLQHSSSPWATGAEDHGRRDVESSFVRRVAGSRTHIPGEPRLHAPGSTHGACGAAAFGNAGRLATCIRGLAALGL